VLEWTQVQAAAREQRAAVEAVLRRRELSPRLRERVEMVKAVALGDGPEAIATWSGRSMRTVGYWLERFVTSGLGALGDAPRVGRPPRATPAYLAALEAALSTPPRQLGLEFDVWTSERLSASLAEQTGIRLSPGWLRVLLAQRDWVSGRPKLSVRHLRQAAEVTACAAALEAAEKKTGPPIWCIANCIIKMRPIWTPTRISAGCGIDGGSRRSCRQPGPTAA
jgi:transposase